MSDETRGNDPGGVWRGQPEEKTAVDLRHLVNRRTRELYSSTRAEIILSIGAALFFVAVMAWRFELTRDRLLQLGIAIVIVWILVTLYRYRDRILGRDPLPADAATVGLEYYRKELERRRDHLKNEWVWHGPLFLASAIFALTFVGKAFPNVERLRSVLPLVVLLAIWTATGLWRRRQQVKGLEREINEIGSRP
jgi:hypothetical protein